jgi:LAO/AO transport system kinase
MPVSDAENLENVVSRLLAGDRRALSRTISEVENETDAGRRALRLLYPKTGHAHSIGITGSPGAGKSTLTALLARAYREQGRGVGVVAVDPSSPFTQGAILGDRIRMQDLTSDPEVFVRSMATRGSVGGLAAAAADVTAVLDAAGKDVVLIETVGAGQDEVEVATVAQTTLVISTPGMGDGIQSIKAGIIEIADVLVVNKADLPGTDAVVAQLQMLIGLAPPKAWPVPVVKVSAATRDGLGALLDAVHSHRAYVEQVGDARNAVARAKQQIIAAAQAELARRLQTGDTINLDGFAERVAARALDPRSAAGEILRQLT